MCQCVVLCNLCVWNLSRCIIMCVRGDMVMMVSLRLVGGGGTWGPQAESQRERWYVNLFCFVLCLCMERERERERER